MRTFRLSNLLVSLALMSFSLIETITLVLRNTFDAVMAMADQPISNIVESIYAAGHALKARFVAAVVATRQYTTNFAANHVAMLRSKGPVTA